jgi:hypothetical protein
MSRRLMWPRITELSYVGGYVYDAGWAAVAGDDELHPKILKRKVKK